MPGSALVRGMELSTRHAGGRGVHLLAYLPDPTFPPLVEELGRVLGGRDARVPVMLEKLQECGIEIDAADVRRVAGAATATGRPHVADALVELGAVRDREEAFAKYLSAGRPAYVDRYATPLAEMVGIVTRAGGVGVVAHPWGRHERTTLDESALAALADLGLAGIEVDHQDHDAGERRALRAIARNLGPGRDRLERPPRHRQGRPRPGLQHDRPGRVRPAHRPRPGQRRAQRTAGTGAGRRSLRVTSGPSTGRPAAPWWGSAWSPRRSPGTAPLGWSRPGPCRSPRAPSRRACPRPAT